jgi:hypothetical protein
MSIVHPARGIRNIRTTGHAVVDTKCCEKVSLEGNVANKDSGISQEYGFNEPEGLDLRPARAEAIPLQAKGR